MFQWDIGAFDRPDLDCRCFIRELSRLQYWINLLNSIYAKTQLYWEFNGTRIEAVFCCTTISSGSGSSNIECSWLLTPSFMLRRGWEQCRGGSNWFYIAPNISKRLMITALCVNNSEERGAKTSVLQSATDSIFWCSRNIWFWLYYSFYSLSLDLF